MRPLATIFAASALLSGAAAAETLPGHWTSFEWVGFRPSDDGRCLLAVVVERRYELTPRAGSELTGHFVNVQWTSVVRANGACSLNGESITGAALRANIWQLAGYREASTARLSGTFDHCLGSPCNAGDPDRKSFTLGLSLEGNRLIDKDESEGGASYTFHRLDWHSQRVAEAQKEYERFADTLANGEPAAVRSILATNLSRQEVEATITLLPIVRQRLRKVVSRSLVYANVANIKVGIQRSGIDQFAVLIFQANMEDGTKGPETVVLQRENSSWRLFMF